MRAALMARVSDASQGGDHQSIPAQLAAMRARCTREGWTVVREDVAEGESAYTADLRKRPVLRSVVEAAEDKAPVEWAALIGRLESLVPLLDARPIEEVPSSEARGPGEWE